MSVLLYLLGAWKWPSNYKGVPLSSLFFPRCLCVGCLDTTDRELVGRPDFQSCCLLRRLADGLLIRVPQCHIHFFLSFCFFLFPFLLIHAADQAVIVELRNQIHLLKNQHHDQLEQLNRERKWRNNEKCHDIRTSSSHHSLSNSVSRRFIFLQTTTSSKRKWPSLLPKRKTNSNSR